MTEQTQNTASAPALTDQLVHRERLAPNALGVATVTWAGDASLIGVHTSPSSGNLDAYAHVVPDEATTTMTFVLVRTGQRTPLGGGYLGTYTTIDGVIHVYRIWTE